MVSTFKQHLTVSSLLLLCSATLLPAAETGRTPTPEEFRELVKQYQGGVAPGRNVRPPKGVEQYNKAVALDFKKDPSPAELKEAARLYQEALDAGIVQAQVNLGIMYVEGKGVKKDLKKGQNLLNAAAKKGESGADVALARLYLSGKDVKVDEKKGEFHLSRAAKNGNPAAVKALAEFRAWKKKNELAMKEYQEVLKRSQQGQASRPSQLPQFTVPQARPTFTLKDLQRSAASEPRLPILPGYRYLGANPLLVQKAPAMQLPAADSGGGAAGTVATPPQQEKTP